MKINRKEIGVVVLGLALIATGIVVRSRQNNDSAQIVHTHAAFAVFHNGQPVDFSIPQYMSVEPCNDKEHAGKNSPAQEQLERVHLHDGVGDIVHVHRANVRWAELFMNLKYVFPGPPVVYRNGQKLDNSLAASIEPYDRILIVADDIGQPAPDIATLMASVPAIDRIKAIEQTSETCGT